MGKDYVEIIVRNVSNITCKNPFTKPCQKNLVTSNTVGGDFIMLRSYGVLAEDWGDIVSEFKWCVRLVI